MELETLVAEQEKKQVYTPPVLTELGDMKTVTSSGAPAAGADGPSN